MCNDLHMFKAEPGGIRERGKAERRVRIVDAAAELLQGGGIDALTMRALSDRAGVSVPTIYNLIGGRDEVLVAVLDRWSTVFDAEQATLAADPVDRCFDLGDRIVATFTMHPVIARSIIAEGLAPMLADADTPVLRRYALALWVAIVEGGEQGDIDDTTSAELLVEHIVSVTAVRFFGWATSDPGDDPDGALLRAAVQHGMALALSGVTRGSARRRALERLADARHELAHTAGDHTREEAIR